MPMHSFSRLLLTGACAAILAGCATTSAPLTHPTAQVGAYRDTIDLSGKLAVSYQKEGQPQAFSGGFSWSQRPGNIDVAFMGPLGQTVATINVTPTAATLTQSGAAPRTEPDIDTLTAHTLGWTLPVSGLRDWLQGYATAAGGKRFTASPVNNTVTTNDGWRLRFVEWQDSAGAAAVPMPRRINAERSATGGELAIHIFVAPAGG
jgi:outer membrane lipoprotein LolB